jgi:hypothetical protein
MLFLRIAEQKKAGPFHESAIQVSDPPLRPLSADFL